MEKNKSIAFVLPCHGRLPSGGLKVVYEYANRLTELDYSVSVIHIANFFNDKKYFKGFFRYFYYWKRFQPKWFKINPQVKMKWRFSLLNKFLQNHDFIIATSWETAERINKIKTSHLPHSKKIYLIQGDERTFDNVILNKWGQRVEETWRGSFDYKIVISTALEDSLAKRNIKTCKIENGLSFEDYGIDILPQRRNPYSLLMMYHILPLKGTAEGLEAIKILKEKIPNLKLTLFGAYKRPKSLATWIDYYAHADSALLRKLYNECSIFISPSHSEGWGLPVAEAMQCGCATIVTNILGFKDFVTENQTSLTFAPGNILELVKQLERLIEDDASRIELAINGYKNIQKFTWDHSIQKLIQLLV